MTRAKRKWAERRKDGTDDGTHDDADRGRAGRPDAAVAANIKVDRPGASERGERIQIHFESGSPIVADVDGTRHFVCDLVHPVWGPGHARGVVLADGAVRNVLTFPPGLP